MKTLTFYYPLPFSRRNQGEGSRICSPARTRFPSLAHYENLHLSMPSAFFSQEPAQGYADLLPCPNKVVTLDGNYIDGLSSVLSAEASASLGLSPRPSSSERLGGGGGGAILMEEEAMEADGEGEGMGIVMGIGNRHAERDGPFDVSVLCTAVSDVNHLLKPSFPVDRRLVDALLWDVKVRRKADGGWGGGEGGG